MNSHESEHAPGSHSGSQFHTTRWTQVLAAGQRADPNSQHALAELCQAYWYPVYAYIRQRGADVHEAQDLTQQFFQQVLEKESLAAADPERGRFRSFLITACKRFLTNEWHKARAAKRGGGRSRLSLDFDAGESTYGIEAVDNTTPDQLI